MSEFPEAIKSPIARHGQYLTAAMLSIAAVVLLAGGWKIASFLALVAGALALIIYVLYSMVKGNGDPILIGWVLLFPIGYYFLSYPRERPVIQFDRMLILVLLGCVFASNRSQAWGIPKDLRRAGIAWALFLAVTLASFLMATNILTVGRHVLDTYVLPPLLGWYVVRQFRLSTNAKSLHIAICIISVYSAALGVAEVVLQRHIFDYGFAMDNPWASDPTDVSAFAFLRPEGPFYTSSSFALIGLISFFLLAFLWSEIREDSGAARRYLHVLASGAALLQALLPLFRSVFITIVVVTVIDIFWSTGYRRALRIAALGLASVLVLGLATLAPTVFQNRSDSANVYGRLAQNNQTWKIISDHPLLGIGMMNYVQVVQSNPRYQMSSFNGVEAVDSPHNTLALMAAETGILGLIPFFMAQVLLFAAFWRLRKRGERGAVVYRYFVFIFLSYWMTGLTETSGAYGDLNIWFVLAVSLLYRFGVGEASEARVPTLTHVFS